MKMSFTKLAGLVVEFVVDKDKIKQVIVLSNRHLVLFNRDYAQILLVIRSCHHLTVGSMNLVLEGGFAAGCAFTCRFFVSETSIECRTKFDVSLSW